MARKTVAECREAHKNVPTTINGAVAWIVGRATPGLEYTYGVRFYSEQHGKGYTEMLDDGSVCTLVEKLERGE